MVFLTLAVYDVVATLIFCGHFATFFAGFRQADRHSLFGVGDRLVARATFEFALLHFVYGFLDLFLRLGTVFVHYA